MSSLLKKLAVALHRLAAVNHRLAGLYLRAYRVLQLFPDGKWKSQVWNSLSSVSWPNVSLPPAQVEVASASVRLVPHLGECDFAAHLFRRLPHEPPVMNWMKGRSYAVVLELGANVGVYSVAFSKLWPRANVFSFEPSRAVFSRLIENLRLNGSTNVIPFNCAIAAETGFADFHEPQGHMSNGSLDPAFAAIFSDEVASTKTIVLPGRELAALVANRRPLLIKIDVEGAEPMVLQSLEELLRRRTPDIVLEVLETTSKALNAIPFLSEIYSFYHLTPEGPVKRESFVVTAYRDYALLPRNSALVS